MTVITENMHRNLLKKGISDVLKSLQKSLMFF